MSAQFPWRRPVVKVGTSTLTGGTDQLSLARIADIVEQLSALHAAGLEPLLVSSGAVAVGRQRLDPPVGFKLPPAGVKLPSAGVKLPPAGSKLPPAGGRPGRSPGPQWPGPGRSRKDVPFKQVLAAVGQSRLMHLYDQLFDFHGITSAQVLLTRADLAERQRYLNARGTLLELCARRVIPIVNENDVVASEELELRVGDNDTLSGLVATLIDADVLVLVSDIPGLYTADPELDPAAELVREVPAITPDVEAYAGGARSALGTGGMATKLTAARLATASGAEVRIVDGREPNVIVRALAGEPIGTRFLPRTDPLEGRKRWILSGMRQAGGITVDHGAVRALRRQGASLLPAGILAVTRSFERGDALDILAEDGSRIARGIANYGSDDVQRIRGLRSAAIESALGYSYGDYVVHRNDLVVLDPETSARHA